MKLLWIDLETTGLDPLQDSILEVAWCVADLADPFPAGPYHERTIHFDSAVTDFIRDMHTKNGLLEECRWSTNTITIVERELLACVPAETDKELKTVVAGNSVHFDLGFLRYHMPTLAKRLSHRCYDVSAVQLFARSLGMPKSEKGAEPHRALEDVSASVLQAHSCVRWLQTQTYLPHP